MMTQNRRNFLKRSSLLAGALVLPPSLSLFANDSVYIPHSTGKPIKFFHTSDLQGKFNPELSRFGGLREILIRMKQEQTIPLLMDAGDFLSPDAGFQDQKNFIQTMNSADYTCANIGRNELAQGQSFFASLLPYMDFSLVNCNYNFSHEKLKSTIKEYIIISWGDRRIGITGVGPKIDGIASNNPYTALNNVTAKLRDKEQVDIVICLSHLEESGTWNNRALAAASSGVDFIIAGHPDFYRTGNLSLKNKLGNDVILCQGGLEGSVLGVLELDIDKQHNVLVTNFKQEIPGLMDKSKLARTMNELNAQLT